MALVAFSALVIWWIIRNDLRWERRPIDSKRRRKRRRVGRRAMVLRWLNRVLGLVGVRVDASLKRVPKDPLDAMLVDRRVPTEKRDWN